MVSPTAVAAATLCRSSAFSLVNNIRKSLPLLGPFLNAIIQDGSNMIGTDCV
jgi:hypothetical protein